jgi:hypothetical protein
MDRHQLAFRGAVLAAEIEKTTKELEALLISDVGDVVLPDATMPKYIRSYMHAYYHRLL